MKNKINSFKKYKEEYKKSIQNPELFWAKKAKQFCWQKKWDTVLKWDFKKPEIKWFDGGKLNITNNCLDRHLKNYADKIAIKWISNNPEEETINISYSQLHRQVCKFSNVLKKNNIKVGDRICIYMPMVPEIVVAVLACARIGAIHSVVFAGFSASSLKERINDASCNLLITSDGGFRGDKIIPLKNISDEAMKETPSIKKCIVLKRTNKKISMHKERDIWWHEEMSSASDKFNAETMDSEDPLFILYTSGSTGKPKGILHTVAGYMIYTSYTFKNVFQYDEQDVYWCTADIGWITGHSYIIYGPLLNGATSVIFEGVPSYPHEGRFWEIIEKEKINIFYTAPTAIRALQAKGEKFITPFNLKSLKVLGTVGEPINDDAWNWYDKHVGNNNCPIVDSWWQTETGGIMISNLAGVTPSKATFATFPLPGIQPCIVDDKGDEINDSNTEGNLCVEFPWPSIARTIYGDHKRFKDTYFKKFKNKYFTGDGALKNKNGMYKITGRVDDVIIVSGHNLGTAEIESAINQHQNICESAVVEFPHKIKGHGIHAFVIFREPPKNLDQQKEEINYLISSNIGPIAKADKIQFVEGLPKTRSGKIMRRILRKVASGETKSLGDTSTLLDPSIIDKIKSNRE